MTARQASVSFVIPCLNEQATLGAVLDKIREVCDGPFAGRETEIIVSDNGSTDDSIGLARARGVRVVHCKERGYGAALRFGIDHALHEVIVFADADDTYDFGDTPRLVTELEAGCDLVLGSRLRGSIDAGAMPFLHRYLGTPLLTACINLLYARGSRRLSDCNSGFRAFYRDRFFTWDVGSSGMEFASEMLVKALKHRARVSEVPIHLAVDRREGRPHLRRWRDGMRHLLQIFVESPYAFWMAGTTLNAASWIVMLVSLFFGPVSVGGANAFGIHTMMLALMGSLFGVSTWGIGLLLAVRQVTEITLYRKVLDCGEAALFWASASLATVCAALFGWIVWQWALRDFRALALEKETLAVIALASNGISVVFSVITAHLMKRT